MMAATRIALITNCPEQRAGILSALHGVGGDLEVIVAQTIEEFPAQSESRAIDCVAIGRVEPPSDVPRAIQAAKRSLKDVPLILISPCTDRQAVQESLDHGAQDVLSSAEACDGTSLWRRVQVAVRAARESTRCRRRVCRRLRALRRETLTDPLTGLHNRRHFIGCLQARRGRSDRREQVAIAMIDLDHFKQINDGGGHAMGDAMLVEVARAIRHECREDELIVRWGGEEFVVVRGSASPQATWDWANRLRENIAALRVRHAGVSRSITASIGLAVVPTAEFGEQSIWIADRALYLAKELGRNRVCTWPMVQAFETAEAIQLDPLLTLRERAARFARVLRDRLGPTQRQYLGPHGRLVQSISNRIACEMNLLGAVIDRIGNAGLVHDVGKAAIPESVLGKPAPLNVEEKAMIAEHTRHGASIVAAMGFPESVVRLVSISGERYDSDRFRRLHPSDRVQAGIIAAADALAAMSVDLPHAPQRGLVAALAELERGSGRQFDPAVVRAAQQAYGTECRLVA
ncbi:MAG: diguanylate cyclase [Phycisphaerae bacterium]|nr:diguanylate cyclase [Phycisphaerae bacterium]